MILATELVGVTRREVAVVLIGAVVALAAVVALLVGLDAFVAGFAAKLRLFAGDTRAFLLVGFVSAVVITVAFLLFGEAEAVAALDVVVLARSVVYKLQYRVSHFYYTGSIIAFASHLTAVVVNRKKMWPRNVFFQVLDRPIRKRKKRKKKRFFDLQRIELCTLSLT